MSMTAKDPTQTYNDGNTTIGHGPHSKSTSGGCCEGNLGSLHETDTGPITARDKKVLRSKHA